jgi:3-deoxy-D-manno-octulosonic-acid transferase
MRKLYTLLLYLLSPLVVLRLAWRGLRAPGYWRRWPERFGSIRPAIGERVVWLHAVSVGEVQAAAPRHAWRTCSVTRWNSCMPPMICRVR